MIGLNELVRVEFHIIAQIIKAEFVISPVSHTARILFFALVIVHIVLNTADGQTQKIMNFAHPFGIS